MPASQKDLASLLPCAFAYTLSFTGKTVHERTRHIDFGQRALGRQLTIPAFHRPDIVRVILRLSASMGDRRAPEWSGRRIVICSLFLFLSDAPPAPDASRPIRLVRDRNAS